MRSIAGRQFRHEGIAEALIIPKNTSFKKRVVKYTQMFKIPFLLITTALIFLMPKNLYAVENPISSPNNRFGIHILDENDLTDAANLVNSSGGDWGYVTLVIRKDERDTKRWQDIFNKMRRLHLIPIIRVATRQQVGGWEKPNPDEIDGWVSFFNSLNWVIQNRYIVIGNEPNHASEWGGEINPEEYSDYLKTFSQKLKNASSDYFILPGGLDASAPNSKLTLGEEEFLKRMVIKNPDIFLYLDGWTSHSYPNPEFSGSQDETGRGSVRTFEWEINFLKSLGVSKDLPVFITETGWAHNMEGTIDNFQDTESIAQKLKTAYQTAWNNEDIVAVTPFILNYQDVPFDKFSWKKADSSFYSFYYEIKDLAKPKGKPIQIVSVDILTLLFPPIIPTDDGKKGLALIKNNGQSIWEANERILSEYHGYEIALNPVAILRKIEPGEKTIAIVAIK